MQFDPADGELRWRREAAYFDAQEYSADPIDPLTIERYFACRKPWLHHECLFWMMGDVRGKRILEIGCGSGNKALMLAFKGAYVTGVDVSGRAIDIAKERAVAHGVQHLTEFICVPLELYTTTERFDLIVGLDVLHHLLPVLEQILKKLTTLGHSGTRYLFMEPICTSKWIRQIRLMVPVPVSGTPDERPLEDRDLAMIRSCFPSHTEVRYFGALLRAGRIVLRNGNYVRSGGIAKLTYDILGRVDQLLLQKLHLRFLASVAIIDGRHSPVPQ